MMQDLYFCPWNKNLDELINSDEVIELSLYNLWEMRFNITEHSTRFWWSRIIFYNEKKYRVKYHPSLIPYPAELASQLSLLFRDEFINMGGRYGTILNQLQSYTYQFKPKDNRIVPFLKRLDDRSDFYKIESLKTAIGHELEATICFDNQWNSKYFCISTLYKTISYIIDNLEEFYDFSIEGCYITECKICKTKFRSDDWRDCCHWICEDINRNRYKITYLEQSLTAETCPEKRAKMEVQLWELKRRTERLEMRQAREALRKVKRYLSKKSQDHFPSPSKVLRPVETLLT